MAMTDAQLDRLERIAQKLAEPDLDRRRESRKQLARLRALLEDKPEFESDTDQRPKDSNSSDK